MVKFLWKRRFTFGKGQGNSLSFHGLFHGQVHRPYIRIISRKCKKNSPDWNSLQQASADLGKLLTGRATGRENEEEIIIAMNLGLAIMDLATAARIYSRVLEKGIGTVLPL